MYDKVCAKIASLPGRELKFLIMGWIRFYFFTISRSQSESQKAIYHKTFQNRNDAGRFTYENNKRLC